MELETDLEYDHMSNTLSQPEDLKELDVDYNALGQSIDTTWGRSSTPHTARQSVKFSILGQGYLLASFVVVVRFGSQRQMIDTKLKCRDESVSVINANVAAVKKRYKDITDSALELKEKSSSDSYEIISTTFHNPTRTAYYRRETVFEIM